MAAADRAELVAHFGFQLDQFQLRALDALDAGSSVLVAAPTGSGKTVVAEYAIDAAVARGKRAFYTAPIKALSNQKYHDLAERLGPHMVGLLTGDNSINGDAPVVVMTTEVLRNMIYGRSRAPRAISTWWCSTRSTSCRTPTADRCGRRSSSTCPSTFASCACRPR